MQLQNAVRAGRDGFAIFAKPHFPLTIDGCTYAFYVPDDGVNRMKEKLSTQYRCRSRSLLMYWSSFACIEMFSRR